MSLSGWSQWLAHVENFNPSSLNIIEDSMFMGENGEIQTLVKWGKERTKSEDPSLSQNSKTQSGHKGTENRLFLKVHKL